MRKVFVFLVLGMIFAVAGLTLLNHKSPVSRQFAVTEQPSFQLPGVTFDQIFSEDHTWVATLSAQRVRTLIATGDVGPGRTVNFLTTKNNDFRWPYDKTADVLRQADTTFVNLEGTLVAGCTPTTVGMIFCGDPRNIEGLVFAGVDVVNLANNHATNYGLAGIESTEKVLAANGIQVTGINGPVVRDVRGLKFAFLGYDDIPPLATDISVADTDRIKKEIRQARASADVVVAAFHWGVEYTSQPTARQVELAHLAVDAGADLIVGNHPHWIQPVEIYRGKVIMYAYGNFVFDQMWSEKTREGVVGRYTFYDNRLIDAEFLPIKIDNYGQARFLEGEEREGVLKELTGESRIRMTGRI